MLGTAAAHLPAVQSAAGKAAGTLAAAAGRSVARKVRGSAETKALAQPLAEALIRCVEHARHDNIDATDQWWSDVAALLLGAIDAPVARDLIALAVRDAAPGTEEAVRRRLQDALEASGRDLRQLNQTLDVDEFVFHLPAVLLDEVARAARDEDSPLRPLVDAQLLYGIWATLDSRRLAPLSPQQLRDELTRLLIGLDHDARTRRLPAYLPGRVDFEQLTQAVGLRVGLRRGPKEAGSDKDVYLPPALSDPAGAREEMDWATAAARFPRLVVLADPGYGKSWLIRAETHRLATQALTSLLADTAVNDLVLPVPARLDELTDDRDATLGAILARLLIARHRLSPSMTSWLRDRIDTGSSVLLLDAYDEVPAADRQRVGDLVTDWAGHSRHGHLVLTSRVAGYSEPLLPVHAANHAELLGFTPENIEAFITTWQLPAGAEVRLRERLRDQAFAGMARVPLLLALLCAVADHATRPLPSHRAALYERILIRVLRHEHRPPAAAADHVTRLLDVLAPVAYRCAVTPTGWADRMSSDTLIQAIRESGPPYAELLARKRDAAALLGELAQYDGILVPSGTETADDPPSYLFLHRTFHEYLGARHLAHLPDDQWQAVVEEHLWFDPDWEQVILLLTAQLPQPETLLQLLLDQPHDPFHHALRMAGLALSELPEQSPALPSPAAEEAVRRLLDLLRSPGYGTSMAADVLRTVGVRLQPHAEKSLLSVLTDNDFDDVRRAAARALAGRPGEQITQGLLSVLTDNSDGVRRAAAEALAARPGEQITQGLLSVLTDNDFAGRRAAARALAARPGEQVTQGLLSVLTDNDFDVRRVAARALAARPGEQVLTALLADLTGAGRQQVFDLDLLVGVVPEKAYRAADIDQRRLLLERLHLVTWSRRSPSDRGPWAIPPYVDVIV